MKKYYFNRTYRFSSFPKYLLVQLAKFTFSRTWEPIKYGRNEKIQLLCTVGGCYNVLFVLSQMWKSMSPSYWTSHTCEPRVFYLTKSCYQLRDPMNSLNKVWQVQCLLFFCFFSFRFIVEIDEGIVMQLMSMGFNIEGCKRAVFHTNNQGVFEAFDIS